MDAWRLIRVPPRRGKAVVMPGILARRPAEEQAALELEAPDDLQRDGQAARAGKQAEKLAPGLPQAPGAVEVHRQGAVAAPPDRRVGIDQLAVPGDQALEMVDMARRTGRPAEAGIGL